MQRSKQSVERALRLKGFEARETHHRYFIYVTTQGERTSITTKTSHGGRRDLSDPLLSQMARQCKLNRAQFLELVDCPLDRDAYEAILRSQGGIE